MVKKLIIRQLEYLFFLILLVVFATMFWNYARNFSTFKWSQVIFGQQVYTFFAQNSLAQQYQNFEVGDVTVPATGHEASIPVLLYHAVPTLPSDFYDVSADQFKEQMFTLKKLGYETVTLNQLYDFMVNHKGLPEKSFVITFDDGIKTSYDNTDQILRFLDYHAVMFPIAGYSLEDEDNSYYLNPEEIKQMNTSGVWDIQAHSYRGHHLVKIAEDGRTKPFLANKLWLDKQTRLETDAEYEKRIGYDLRHAKDVLEKELQHPVKSFAVPFNDIGQYGSNYEFATEKLFDTIQGLYDMVFLQFKPLKDLDYRANYNDRSERFQKVMRISANRETTPQTLMGQISASESKPLPYEEKFNNEFNWINLGHLVESTNNQLLLASTDDSTVAQTYLDGSYMWQNYRYSIRFVWEQDQSLHALARYKNSLNFVACGINASRISIEETINDSQKLLTDVKFNPILGKEYELTIAVDGSRATCYLDNVQMLQTTFDSNLIRGGVGLKIWHPEIHTSKVIITKLNVEKLRD